MSEKSFLAVKGTIAGSAGKEGWGSVRASVAGKKAWRRVRSGAKVTRKGIWQEGFELVGVGKTGQVHILVMAIVMLCL
jgi:hypothetical protein